MSRYHEPYLFLFISEFAGFASPKRVDNSTPELIGTLRFGNEGVCKSNSARETKGFAKALGERNEGVCKSTWWKRRGLQKHLATYSAREKDSERERETRGVFNAWRGVELVAHFLDCRQHLRVFGLCPRVHVRYSADALVDLFVQLGSLHRQLRRSGRGNFALLAAVVCLRGAVASCSFLIP